MGRNAWQDRKSGMLLHVYVFLFFFGLRRKKKCIFPDILVLFIAMPFLQLFCSWRFSPFLPITIDYSQTRAIFQQKTLRPFNLKYKLLPVAFHNGLHEFTISFVQCSLYVAMPQLIYPDIG